MAKKTAVKKAVAKKTTKKKTAVKKTSALDDILKTTGSSTLGLSGHVPWYHDLGNFAMNFINSGKFIAGGLPGGKIIEVFGAEATAKSLLGYCFLGNIQMNGGYSILIDAERSGNAKFAKAAGHVDVDSLIMREPEHWGEVESYVFNVVKAIRERDKDCQIGIMLDSIGVIQSEREAKYANLPQNPTKTQIKEVGPERPGERARASGDFLRRVQGFLANERATLYIINQLRTAIGAQKWEPQDVTSGGGRALPYYASTRLLMKAQKKIVEKISDIEIPMGNRLGIVNRKSRSYTPGLKTDGIKLYFDGGIDPLSGLLTVLIVAKRVEVGKAGNYKVYPEYTEDGEMLNFKASKDRERNEMPLDVILKCPKLVDGESREEVEEYLARWQTAMDASNNDKIEEIDMDSEVNKAQELLGADYYKGEDK
jgi:recombination protein RecA